MQNNTQERNPIQERNAIYLAALLHDIGKFWQRYDPNGVEKSEILNSNIKNLESIYCPKDVNGYYSHKHVLWTAQFFDKYRVKVNKILGYTQNDDFLLRLAASHHQTAQEDELAKIIEFADKLSSSAERIPKQILVPDGQAGWDKFKKVPLKSIFDLIWLQDNIKYPVTAKNSIKTKALSIDELPVADENYVPNYKCLWEAFEADFQKIPNSLSSENFIQTLDALLHKYAYCIPSSTIDEPDISLYDHSKTTAFLAIALYYYLKSYGKNISEINDEDKPFILLGGDISGIQDFIYDIPNKGAAKQLKGRSFYIHLLAETIVRYILKEFNLLRINVVYNSGGNFYILLPNIKDIKEKIADISTTVNSNLRALHGTDIYVSMAYEEISIANLKQHECPKEPEKVKCLSQIWDNLISEKILKAKNLRYFKELKEKYDDFFEPHYLSKKSIENKLEILGRELKNAKYIVFSHRKHPNIKDEFTFDLNLGIYAYTFDKFPLEFEDAEIIRLNNTDFLEEAQKNNTYRFDFYGGNDYPTYEDEANNRDEKKGIKTFEDLAQGKDLDRLGIVRMDVDNLGKIFAQGFHPRLRSFSRLSALSRNLDFFFKGYLNTIWASNNDFKKYTYILYSGGDDLFLIGRWDKTLEFAHEIKKKFSEFTRTQEFGLSGGISIERPKYPIRRAAFNAGEAEHRAKDFSIELSKVNKNYPRPYQKNAFTLFGVPLSWQSDFEKVLELKNYLIKYSKGGEFSKALLNSIKLFNKMREFQLQKKDTESWRWTMAYYLQRAKERLSGKDVNVKDFIEDLKISIFTDFYKVNGKDEALNSNYTFLKLLAIAARWAELEMRT